MTTTRGLALFSLTALMASLAFAGCSSSSDSGSGGKAGTGGSGNTGGSTGGTGGGKGGTGGSTGGTGGSSDGGCLPAPDPSTTNACDVCQDDQHGGCACDTQFNDCMNDTDCSAIYDCTTAVDDAGNPICSTLDAAGVLCTLACVDANPAGKTKYLAWEKCLYCQFCGSACDSTEYCTTLDNPPDGGTDSGTGGSAGAAGASGDAASDVSTD